VVQAQHILHAARDSRSASARLGSGPDPGPIRSVVVTAAFSAELYIKYLSFKSRGLYDRGHDISVLFAALPDDVRRDVASAYRGGGSVESTLLTMRGVFLDWRYIFEHQHASFSLSLADLRALVEALESVAGKL
jgi:hypothetical protein